MSSVDQQKHIESLEASIKVMQSTVALLKKSYQPKVKTNRQQIIQEHSAKLKINLYKKS